MQTSSAPAEYELGYFNNYLSDNESCVIVGVQATATRFGQESAAARDMLVMGSEW